MDPRPCSSRKIVDRKVEKRKIMYLVHREGTAEPQWELKSSLSAHTAMIRRFEREFRLSEDQKAKREERAAAKAEKERQEKLRERNERMYRAKHRGSDDHEAFDEESLGFKKGDALIVEEENGDYWFCISVETGEEGWVDQAFLEKIPPKTRSPKKKSKAKSRPNSASRESADGRISGPTSPARTATSPKLSQSKLEATASRIAPGSEASADPAQSIAIKKVLNPSSSHNGKKGAGTPGAAVQLICATCGHVGEKIKTCSRCRTIAYCSRECQVSDWKRHKRDCRKAVKEQQLFEEVQKMMQTSPSGNTEATQKSSPPFTPSRKERNASDALDRVVHTRPAWCSGKCHPSNCLCEKSRSPRKRQAEPHEVAPAAARPRVEEPAGSAAQVLAPIAIGKEVDVVGSGSVSSPHSVCTDVSCAECPSTSCIDKRKFVQKPLQDTTRTPTSTAVPIAETDKDPQCAETDERMGVDDEVEEADDAIDWGAVDWGAIEAAALTGQ